uniref:Cytochrome c oxidase subunit 3 n=1 Tax=Eucryptorrhynchus brandti TaxID=436910 RepID=A0A0A7E7M7_EUCBR|nr:cytochrome c oxidase subunit III [Eucryptorrhynchus brandti]AIY61445.1 cytochrome c oxidase subunit III [Eucryptorrhynchus brandti]AJT57326.1 cytochrome c oxidase subunit III [Eucryptorrhynchus brandti]ALF04093.1 cytochrome coxidase subunit III [Eucryptorrhynchus brandti]
MKKNHPFHLVDQSPWPLLASLSVFSFMMGMIKWFHLHQMNLLILSTITTMMIMAQWWRDIIRESTFQGHHTLKVTLGLRWGMILFITSEVFFFLAFFWAFFHASLSPSIELGMNWPPKGIQPFNPLEIPLLNTLILLSSGLTITWSHHSIMENDYIQSLQSLLFTVLLGFYFTLLQMYEYKEAPFTIADSIYGSTFFMTTGLHGLHVIIGSTFLFICLIRLYYNHFSSTHHFGFEAAAWYWHFVDVVWLFLYISIYWWGS